MRVAMNIGGHYHSTPSVERKKDYYYDLVEVWEAKNAMTLEEFCKKSLQECKKIVQTARVEWHKNRERMLQRKPSIEKLERDYKSSDNYLMNNPFREEYESMFDA